MEPMSRVLRQERERRKISLQEVERLTRIPLRDLQLLEGEGDQRVLAFLSRTGEATVSTANAIAEMLKLPVPELSAAFDGRIAFVSEEVMPTVCVAFVIRFQLASTALTVRLKELPAF